MIFKVAPNLSQTLPLPVPTTSVRLSSWRGILSSYPALSTPVSRGSTCHSQDIRCRSSGALQGNSRCAAVRYCGLSCTAACHIPYTSSMCCASVGGICGKCSNAFARIAPMRTSSGCLRSRCAAAPLRSRDVPRASYARRYDLRRRVHPTPKAAQFDPPSPSW